MSIKKETKKVSKSKKASLVTQLEDIKKINVSLVIPSIKSREYLENKINEIKKVSSIIDEYYFTCDNTDSASVNRNKCLNNAYGTYIIMIDDDITGFYKGWDIDLIATLEDESILITAPRLLNKQGKPALMMGDNFIFEGIYGADGNRVCTACIAFRKAEMIRYDENFIGSGFEDDDIMIQLNEKHKGKLVVINNNVKLIHENDMKNQKGKFWEHNKKYFLSKHLTEKDRWHN